MERGSGWMQEAPAGAIRGQTGRERLDAKEAGEGPEREDKG